MRIGTTPALAVPHSLYADGDNDSFGNADCHIRVANLDPDWNAQQYTDGDRF